MDNFICGGYIFTSNFDSGNLHKVELHKWHEDALPNNEAVAIEFNLWTRPDCAGTEYENLNRSWFFFSIQGGDPNKVCKLNIVNLNKQAKLFSQGMHPVIRVGETGKWERIKYSPVYNVHDNEFVLSFLHKPHADITTKFYYAFTFPFTYTDCQIQLARFDSLYQKSDVEMNYIFRRLNVDVDATDVDVNCNTINFESQDAVDVENMQNHVKVVEATTNRQLTSKISILENQSKDEIENDIYYHRELLINSIEGRRIDLLTITSFHNIQKEREYRFAELFPDPMLKRCNKFKNKKLIFISSRVHPGETPASFILNGFLKMLLDRKNRYATKLRKMYVFKIIPLLNPDGVYNGHYRSDVLGHNLNRVYLAPKRETQPSIYAVRKLIRYYHNEKDTDDEQQQPSATTENVENGINIPELNLNNNVDFIGGSTLELDIPSSGLDDTDIDTSNRESSEEKSRTSVLTEINIEAKNNRNIEKVVSTPISTTSTATIPPLTPCSSTQTESSGEPKPGCSTDATVLPPLLTNPSSGTDDTSNINATTQQKCRKNDGGHTVKSSQNTFAKPSSLASIRKTNLPEASTSSLDAVKIKKSMHRMISNQSSFGQTNSLSSRDCCATPNSDRYLNSTSIDSARIGKKKESTVHGIKSNTRSNKINTSITRMNQKVSKHESDSMPITPASSCVSSRTSKRSIFHRKHPSSSPTTTNLNISTDFCKDSNRMNNGSEQSNMFLYIDLHGHASKKGIFMYGNYLRNIAESVECMLLPRLMSLNSHHFHFDACVFSERNMYHKGKRDGLSKEGSGRVAIYKTIGLIKSYTLEGNYNTGKYVNILPPREKEINQRKICTIPPKYTPAIYEEVGRALGPSILDLTESNPSSRLRASEYRSLQGLRNDIERGLLKAEPLQKATTSQTKSKSLKPSTACSSSLTTDLCKENKIKETKERHTTKASISYGKKDKSTNVSQGQRKKGKVLCDVIASTSTTAAPIPTKRQKVVNTKKIMSNDKPDSKDSVTFDLDINNLNLKSDDVPTLAAITSTSLITYIGDDLAAFVEPPTIAPGTVTTTAIATTTAAAMAPITTTTAFNPDIPPYQSSTPFNPFKFPNVPKKSSTFLRKSSASTASMLSINPTVMVPGSKHKSSVIKLRGSNFSGASGTTNNGSRLKSSLRKSSLTKDGRRMKKKSLKADAGIKRKKPKVF